MSEIGNLKKFVECIIQNGGATYQYASNERIFNPKDGFMVSLPTEFEKVVPVGEFDQLKVEVITYLKNPKIAKIFYEHPETFLGAWVDNGKVYLDLSQKFETEEEARKVGVENNQLAIFDNANGQVITLK